MRRQALILVCMVVFGVVGTCHGGSLKKGFYNNTCPNAEAIIKNATEKRVASDPTLPARFLRMHFHDCFVRGCDASVLLNSTTNNTAEKDAIPNLTLAGFDVIDDIKAEVEKKCPNVVSCADVLALAARDAVSFKVSQTPLWEVLTGRRDSLNVQDLVVLSGGHTIGVGHCNAFSNRLYNFTGNGDQDPSLNATYATFLKTQCQSLSDNTTFVVMDPGSGLAFDNNYYVTLKQNKGLFQSDAALLTNKSSRDVVDKLLDSKEFFKEFAKSMEKMGAIGVLTGNAGEIRNKCYVVN
ncbi:hypothetical protein E1A91_D12G007600v1 [Gossypium mustelinum]|uniref:Peroxidase n=1 Tax=Gossypium mustelinum TaxID=34275 RepID=A0A5D2S7U3_GOSMU|nr:hypothetical protein E1A91_D12G007600v1 [Gossypium mustelinum]